MYAKDTNPIFDALSRTPRRVNTSIARHLDVDYRHLTLNKRKYVQDLRQKKTDDMKACIDKYMHGDIATRVDSNRGKGIVVNGDRHYS